MTLTVRALASGSSGNAFLVETEKVALLLDAGLAASHLVNQLRSLRFDMERLGGIVVTHEHSDHASGAATLSRRLNVPLYATAGTLARLPTSRCDVVQMTPERPMAFDDLSVTAFALPHDAAEPVGLLVEHDGHRAVLATDLGCVDAHVREWASLADLLILDANHDLERLWSGPYPFNLKRRIASPRGHLSNEQAADCIAFAAERGRVRWAWLAHLSDTNNSQRRALSTVKQRLGKTAFSVEAVGRSRPSLTWRSGERYLQGRLF